MVLTQKMARKLTLRVVRSIKPPTDGRPYVIEYDSDVAGLGLRVTKGDARSWVFNYRTASRIERRLTIGDAGAWTPDQARAKAKELRREVDEGKDPLADRRDRRDAPTVLELVEHWRAHVAPKKRPRTRQEYEGLLRQLILPAFGNRKVAEVTHADIVRLHTRIGSTAPVRANRCVAFLSTLFNIATSDALKWRTDNPASRTAKHGETPRQSYLEGDSLVRLSAALAARPGQAANAVRLLLLTGARRSEVLGATWKMFGADFASWTKPASTTKDKKEHTIPLGAAARLLLSGIQKAQDPASIYVFPSHGGHLKDIKTSWARICRDASLEGIRLHDLRHSFASLAASGGASLALIGQLLGHSQTSTTSRYAHFFNEAQRAVVERVGAVVDAAENAEVVSLRKP